MSQVPSKYQLLSELIHGLLAGELTDEKCSQLYQMLADDPKCRDYYIEYSTLWALLDEYCENQGIDELPDYGTSILQAFAEEEKTAPAIEIEKMIPERVPVKILKIEKTPRTVNKFSLYSTIISAAAVIFLLIYIWFAPKAASPIATISDSMNAKWATSEYPTGVGERLWDNEGTRWLQKGTVKVAFDYGAEVIIEGPAEFELENAKEMILHSGRLYAVVPRGATGFTVQTPYSTVIDLGTEFGVEVDFDGSTDVHMFTGKASLIPGSIGEKKEGVELIAGQAKTVTKKCEVRDIAFQREAFVRKIDSKRDIIWRGEEFSLADVIGGGNGFGTGRKNACIDPLSGKIEMSSFDGFRLGTGVYTPVKSIDSVDGIFVPDKGDVVINSTGGIYSGFPVTSNKFHESVFNGHYTKSLGTNHELVLDGKLCGTTEYPSIALHCNLGITFDLSKIRQLLPEVKIIAFRARCGISDNAYDDYPRNTEEFYVLVDGVLQFESGKMLANTPAKEINIGLKDNSRFLTLVSTDGDMNPSHDWGIFAEPVLILE